jgi:hypothetical protein
MYALDVGELVVQLKKKGLDATAIPEVQTRKTPDISVAMRHSTVLVELKNRLDDEELEQQLEEVMAGGGVATHTDTTGRKNTVSGIIEEAVEQLNAPAFAAADYRVAWVHAAGKRVLLKKDQIHAALYGTQDIVELHGSPARSWQCYYFENSDFFRYRDSLDAAVISYVADRNLHAACCLNSYSPRYERFRDTEFCPTTIDWVLDPLKLEAEGKILIADTPCERSKEREVLEYVTKKYHVVNVTNIQFKHYEGYARISR